MNAVTRDKHNNMLLRQSHDMCTPAAVREGSKCAAIRRGLKMRRSSMMYRPADPPGLALLTQQLATAQRSKGSAAVQRARMRSIQQIVADMVEMYAEVSHMEGHKSQL